MASTLDQLRQTVRALADNSDKIGNQLAPFTHKFAQESQKVIAAIGNTATGQDKQIAQTLAAATKSLEQTIAALRQVKKTGDEWSARA
ncbi:hypothetical protein D2E25_0602 [Bifidobacterium goeldii]|uniref:Uncharacterized protein n=1 Tax=Bifidobacterium goeldii TaxID=2306975 RepID=A0A430FNA2_9BIFI|nr:hypothetical protein [Bifidobacterium goeldii]RSX54294.1 hypothetical protein D2E25_0602 [Bifidobacterium goeldii]